MCGTQLNSHYCAHAFLAHRSLTHTFFYFIHKVTKQKQKEFLFSQPLKKSDIWAKILVLNYNCCNTTEECVIIKSKIIQESSNSECNLSICKKLTTLFKAWFGKIAMSNLLFSTFCYASYKTSNLALNFSNHQGDCDFSYT